MKKVDQVMIVYPTAHHSRRREHRIEHIQRDPMFEVAGLFTNRMRDGFTTETNGTGKSSNTLTRHCATAQPQCLQTAIRWVKSVASETNNNNLKNEQKPKRTARTCQLAQAIQTTISDCGIGDTQYGKIGKR
jgi:hypothetical protein